MMCYPIVELPCSNPTANTLRSRVPSLSRPSASAFRKVAEDHVEQPRSSCSVSPPSGAKAGLNTGASHLTALLE